MLTWLNEEKYKLKPPLKHICSNMYKNKQII